MTTIARPPVPGGAVTPGAAARLAAVRRPVRIAGAPAYLVCLLAYLPANMFSGNSGRLGFPVGPDRLLLAAGVVLLLLDPRPWAVVRPRWRTVHTLFGLLLALVVVSASAFDVIGIPFAYFALLDRLVIPFLLFTLAPVIFYDLRSRDLLLKLLVVMGIYLGLTSIFEIVGPHALVFPRYILNPNVGIQFGRARGPFVESEANGLTIAMCGFASGFAMTRLAGWWRTAALLSVVVCAGGVLFCLTRSVWIGTVLALVLIGPAVRQLRRIFVPLAVVAALAVFALITYVPGLSDKVSGRADSQGPVYDRLNTNAAALRIVDAHPLTGVGWTRFIDVVPDWVRQAPDYPITAIHLEVHNVFLGRAAELGLPGALLFVLCVLVGLVGAVLRRTPVADLNGWRVVALGAFFVWVVAANTSPLPYPLPNAMVWLIAGIASSAWISRPGPAVVGPRPIAVA